MRLIDANELMEHVWRDKLDSRELIAKMINNAPTIGWISVKDGLPEPFTIVLVRYTNGKIHTVGYIDKFMTSGTVTHWMSIPKLPKEVEDV